MTPSAAVVAVVRKELGLLFGGETPSKDTRSESKEGGKSKDDLHVVPEADTNGGKTN